MNSIWEKKYGKNANHVKKEKELEAIVNANMIAKQRDTRNHQRRTSNNEQQSWNGARPAHQKVPIHYKQDSGWGGREVKDPQATTSNTKPVHASWEAKQRQKEKEREAMAKPQGKKTVF